MNLAIALCIDRCVRFPSDWLGRLLNSRPFEFIGVLSYSLYLWQQPFLYRHSTWIGASFPQNVILAFAAALGSYYLIEKPFLKLKERLGGSSGKAEGRHGARSQVPVQLQGSQELEVGSPRLI